MNQKNGFDKWKIISIVLGILILLTIVGGSLLILFGDNSKAASEVHSEKKELTAVLPSAEEMKVSTGISISRENGAKEFNIEDANKTDKGSTPTEQHTYEIINTRMTWQEAAEYCESVGGYLATIESQTEYDKIVTLAESSGRKVLWLGAVRNSKQNFEWITDEEFSFTRWLSGEPNNEGGNENYLVMFRVNEQWVWADVPNDVSPYYSEDYVGFVCEFDE